MSCPTCDHTMQFLAQNDRADNFYHCPRCGTVTMDAMGQHGDKVYVPSLVERCREFEKEFTKPLQMGIAKWTQLGIHESINLPGDRPKC